MIIRVSVVYLTTITPLTCYLFLSNSSNLIVTVYAKLERHTSSIEDDRGQTLEPLGREMRHEHFSRLSSSLFMLLSPITHCRISCFRFLHCNVIYLAHAYILYFQISNCNVFVYVTLAFFRVSDCNCFYCNFQTYPEEERPCLSKYWKGKIYFPNHEISLALY